MDAIEQAERVALRASDRCVVLTTAEARAVIAFMRGMGFDQYESDDDLGRAWRVLNNQVDWLTNPDLAEPE